MKLTTILVPKPRTSEGITEVFLPRIAASDLWAKSSVIGRLLHLDDLTLWDEGIVMHTSTIQDMNCLVRTLDIKHTNALITPSTSSIAALIGVRFIPVLLSLVFVGILIVLVHF